ncbi:MAG TPA: hypothetical protein VGT81_15220 [Casimicrobiaceae bacterium]|jgi:hypothetical protein|nr:hypothetical protein [Casimicrobiaceae bacterium]
MNEGAKVEPATVHGESLEQVAQRFKRWREGRVRGEHIPAELWAAAVGMAKEHGVDRIAHELRVDHDGLKRRVERAGGVARVGALDTQFVELFAAPAATVAGMRECVVELENGRGARMRVELNGKGLAGLAGLCSAFWSAA